MIDQTGETGRAEAVVDVDDRDAGGAGVEHAEQGGDAAEAGAVADAGRARRSPGRRRGRRPRSGRAPSMPATTIMTRAAVEAVLGGEQAVQAGHAHVVQAVHAVVHDLGADRGLLGDGLVRRAGRGDQDRPDPGRDFAGPPLDDPRGLVVDGVGDDGADGLERLGRRPRDQQRVAPARRSARAMAAVWAGVLPSPKITSGKPFRTDRWWSTRANPRSSKGGAALEPPGWGLLGFAAESRPAAGARGWFEEVTSSWHLAGTSITGIPFCQVRGGGTTRTRSASPSDPTGWIGRHHRIGFGVTAGTDRPYNASVRRCNIRVLTWHQECFIRTPGTRQRGSSPRQGRSLGGVHTGEETV